MNCPICNEPAEQDRIDVGVGEVPISEYYCRKCDWIEGGQLGGPELDMDEAFAPFVDGSGYDMTDDFELDWFGE